MKLQNEFYADLYKKVPIDFEAFKNLLDDITVKITEEECELCEADVSLQEVEFYLSAFDRVSHEWVQMILSKYGFCEKNQNWIIYFIHVLEVLFLLMAFSVKQ